MPTTKGVTITEIQEFVESHPELCHCIGMLVPPRPGVRLCIVRMEYEHYPPTTPLNDKFFMFLINWQEALWALMSFPEEDLDKLTIIATECGLKTIHGKPASITSEGISYFPITHQNLYYFENVKDHPVYKNDPQTIHDLLKREDLAVDSILTGFSLLH